MNPRRLILAVLPLLAACDKLNEKLSDYTNPTVVEGLMLGVAEPDFDFDLSGTGFDKSSSGVVFLADAASIDEIEEAPISGAAVSMLSDTNGKVAMSDKGDGSYLITSADGFDYAVGEALGLSATVGDAPTTATVNMPAAADASIESTHAQGADLNIDLSAQSFDSVLIAVFDVTSGDLTFSNQPEGIKEIYEFTHGGTEGLVVDIPGTAFPSQSVYAVGIAGLKNAGEDDYEEANTLLSSFMAGKMKFYPVSTMN